MTRALVIVDVQNDFCEGGSLAVAGGAAVAAAISGHLSTGGYDVVAATADYHVDPGAHFSDAPDWVNTWPAHCVAGTRGARFHPALDTAAVQAVFRKGESAAAYSGFEGATEVAVPGGPGSDQPGRAEGAVLRVGLADWLRGRGVDSIDVCGIATDHCVRATALDAVVEGFTTRVLLDLTAGVAEPTTRAALAELGEAGVQLVGQPWVGAGRMSG